jgi:probable rRNA maturation factor
MAKISFNNNGIDPKLKDKTVLKFFLESILDEEMMDFQKISYIFCTDEYLHKLNMEYLHHDTLTDILTFTLSETSLPIISEIYISVERVRENSRTLKTKYDDELHRVMIHGILHLCGFSDHTSELKAEMRNKENYYLNKCKSFSADK